MPFKMMAFKYRRPTVTPEEFKQGYKQYVQKVKECMGDTFPLSIQCNFRDHTISEQPGFADEDREAAKSGGEGGVKPLMPLDWHSNFDFDVATILTFPDRDAVLTFQAKYVTDPAMVAAREKELEVTDISRLEFVFLDEVFEVLKD
ncbi:hypothetical protein BDW71DRAFT_202132 [Aspergillus fruticulosus]